MAFVLDRVYGVRTPSILINHFDTIFKKCQNLKKKFPKAVISIVIPDGVASGVGIGPELLISKLQAKLGKEVNCAQETMSVDLVASATGDHYQEFSPGSARTAGKREVSGIIVTL